VREGYGSGRLRAFLCAYYGVAQDALEVLAEGEYCLLRCGRCGLVYQRFAPAGKLAELLYDEWIDPGRAKADLAAGQSVETAARLMEQLGTALNVLARPPAQVSALDVGMGWGRWCLLAKVFGCRVQGLDVAPACIASARHLGIDVVEWDGLKERQYDLINADQVLEHLPQPGDSLRALASALKPDGLLHVTVPDGSRVAGLLEQLDWNLEGVADRRFMAVHPLEHVNCFDRCALDIMAAGAGLRPVRPSLAYSTSVAEQVDPRRLVRALARPVHKRLSKEPYDHWYVLTGRS
jgi:SAM-dependent methyltransferase